MRRRQRLGVIVSLGLAAALVWGAAGLSGRLHMVQDAQAQPNRPRPPTEATTAYRQAMTELQRDINIRYSGDADRDFAALLIAQQKALAAMAAVELQHGGDAAMRQLAEQVRQESERMTGAARKGN